MTNLNGIRAADHGRVLIVAHSGTGALYTVDPETGASAAIAGVSVPSVDGMELSGKTMWAVQNTNQITRIRLSPDLTTGAIVKVITSPDFETPTNESRLRDADHCSAVREHLETCRPSLTPVSTDDRHERRGADPRLICALRALSGAMRGYPCRLAAAGCKPNRLGLQIRAVRPSARWRSASSAPRRGAS
jgi:hypothetical protein